MCGAAWTAFSLVAMNETQTITELARDFGVTTRAIRYWESHGLVSPAREGGNRIYSKRDQTRLKLALRGKRLGLSLAEIKDLIDMYDTARTSPRSCCPSSAPSNSAAPRWSSSATTSRPCSRKSAASSGSAATC
jgi:DNA-binding transcriptional MerR regulator